MPDLRSATDASGETNAAAALASRVGGDEVVSSTAASEAATPPKRRRRRVWLPLILFLSTCLSTFWVGANQWFPTIMIYQIDDPEFQVVSRQMALTHWRDGLVYMVCVLGILLAHELGHFFATVWYRIPASLPYVIPMPLLPIGTFGAVIGMDGKKADRKQLFDIGLAGPLAGLVIAIPVMILGVRQLDFTQPAFGPFGLNNPLAVELLLAWFQPPGYVQGMSIAVSQLNPFFMAGWFGLLVTGLNMLPVSQLDGGHVIYTLFGKRAHWMARAFMLTALAFTGYSVWSGQQAQWIIMIGLILLIGIDHPPTRDDKVPIGWFRFWLGLASLVIPILCFAPKALVPVL